MNQIIDEINNNNLGININVLEHNENKENNQYDILLEEFFFKLKDIPETLYFVKSKKYEEVNNIFKDGCIEIENTILKENFLKN